MFEFNERLHNLVKERNNLVKEYTVDTAYHRFDVSYIWERNFFSDKIYVA